MLIDRCARPTSAAGLGVGAVGGATADHWRVLTALGAPFVSCRRIQPYRELLYSHHDTHPRERESLMRHGVVVMCNSP